MPRIRELSLLLALCLLSVLASCSARHPAASQPGLESPVSTYFGAQPVPASVDADLWRRLVAEFDRVLQAQGTARRTSSAPIGSGSDVADLWLTSDGGTGADARWSYRNEGDLNLDGSTTVADLVPIGVHYQASSTGSNWLEDQIADADGNGVVSISDLTPIGHNFGGRVAGYELQSRLFAGTDWTPMAWTPFIESVAGSTKYPQYSLHVDSPQVNMVYRVVPTANSTAPYVYGVPSNEVLYGLTAVHFWSQECGGPERSGTSLLNGPTSNTVAWTLQLAGSPYPFVSPVADAYGTVYTCTSAPNPGHMTPGPGTLYAVDRHGLLQWSYRSAKTITRQPVLTVDENILIQEAGGSVLAFSRDGKLKWICSLTDDDFPGSSGLLISNSGMLYALDGTRGLNAIEPNGHQTWWSQLADTAHATTTPSEFDENVLLPLSNGNIGIFDHSNGNQGTLFTNSCLKPVVLDTDYNLLLTDSAQDVVVIVPTVFPLVKSFVPTEGSLEQSPAIVSSENYVVGSTSSTGIDSYSGNVYGFNGDGIQTWTLAMPGGLFSAPVADPAGRIYLPAYAGTGTGVYCISPAHGIAWAYLTPGKVPSSVCPAFNGLLVFHVGDSLAGDATTTLTALGTVTP